MLGNIGEKKKIRLLLKAISCFLLVVGAFLKRKFASQTSIAYLHSPSLFPSHPLSSDNYPSHSQHLLTSSPLSQLPQSHISIFLSHSSPLTIPTDGSSYLTPVFVYFPNLIYRFVQLFPSANINGFAPPLSISPESLSDQTSMFTFPLEIGNQQTSWLHAAWGSNSLFKTQIKTGSIFIWEVKAFILLLQFTLQTSEQSTTAKHKRIPNLVDGQSWSSFNHIETTI